MLDKGVDTTEKSLNKFMSTSENQSGKQVEAAREAASAIQGEIQAFKDLKEAGDLVGAGKKAQEIEVLTNKFNVLEAATKRGANAIKSWSDTIKTSKNKLFHMLFLSDLYVMHKNFLVMVLNML